AGPYVLDDISPVSNGDLVVTVEDDSGRKTKQVYPVATLPSLLRQGEFEYNLALGRKNNNVELKNAFSSGEGTFWLGSLKYGFAFTTLNTAAIIHNKYQSYGGGVTQSLGKLGAIEANYVNAKARYNNGNEKSGNSYNFKYAKSISENTDLQLLTYRHKSKGFVDFSEYYGDGYQFSNIREKSRYEARLSHRFDNFYLNASYWQQNYWQRPGNERGATISGSTTYDKISLYLNGNYSKRPYYRHPEYSVSLSVNIPFDYNERRYYSNNSISYSKYNGTRFNTDVSAVVDDRLNYSIGVDVDSKGNRGSMGSVSYAFDAVQTNLTLSQSNHQTNFSGNVSGSVLATTKSGLLFTKETSNTIGIVNINGMDGVTFNNSLPTNKNGDTVVSLSEYSPNSISINMDNVPDYAELTTTSYNVVPTENAMIYRKFNFEHVRRYILRIKDEKGKILLGGNARTEQGVNAGFVSGK
ncbi:TPA: fimbria/pilus outer membrane usher protein, partial [Escherichia coli]|nr:fimbria/pilus outer membrane usher protein [Escherichia coli]